MTPALRPLRPIEPHPASAANGAFSSACPSKKLNSGFQNLTPVFALYEAASLFGERDALPASMSRCTRLSDNTLTLTLR